MADVLDLSMERLSDLLIESESWLVERILHYAKQQGYSKYTSTLAEAWRASIVGLSEGLVAALRQTAELCANRPKL